IPLAVSAAFHSRYMQVSQKEFSKYLKNFTFSSLKTPVIANATARPYQDKEIPQLLSKQIISSVLWVESVRYLMGQGEQAFAEIGSSILTNMVKEIQRTEQPLKIAEEEKSSPEAGKSKLIQPAVTKKIDNSQFGKKAIKTTSQAAKKLKSSSRPSLTTLENHKITATALGNSAFRKEYGIKYAYLAGGMYMGIASKEMVVRLGKAGMMGFLGTGGLSLRKIKDDVKYIKQELNKG
ncbi:MAG: malonyl CoA-ACP transacylase, partial [Deltaproteobacteria bacterium]|nr:malonyl CoA-ACP transacylase [Deltaproteobacteria bacterium]